MRNMSGIAVSVVSTFLVAACATIPKEPAALAQLEARSGSTVSGSASFLQTAGGVKVSAKFSGLTPGEHGFHLHESGDCSAADAMSAKGHFNPEARAHGDPGRSEHHAGDMPNLLANAQGEATYAYQLTGATLSGPNGLVGRSAVVHADPDDYNSQPAGNSGKRVACGTIVSR